MLGRHEMLGVTLVQGALCNTNEVNGLGAFLRGACRFKPRELANREIQRGLLTLIPVLRTALVAAILTTGSESETRVNRVVRAASGGFAKLSSASAAAM